MRGAMEGKTLEKTQKRGFEEFSKQIQVLMEARDAEKVQREINAYLTGGETEVEKLLLESVVHYMRKEYEAAAEMVGRARDLMKQEEYPALESPYSAVWVYSQLALPRRERPATTMGYKFYKDNIKVLREVDEELAGDIQNSRGTEGLTLVEYWTGLHYFSLKHKELLNLEEEARISILDKSKEYVPVLFAGVGTGQEVRYCMQHTFRGLYGMKRAHYLMEKDLSQLRMLLYLDDFREVLASRELMIFGGAGLNNKIKELFGTLRYGIPQIAIGELEQGREYEELIKEEVRAEKFKPKVRGYYSSKEFRERQKKIAQGELQPRILVKTGRWTTFLRYCAADFEQAFARIGCETRFMMEENDVQSLLQALHWQQLEEFKPDAVFMVTHARPSAPNLPKELPFICYVQDKCGPVLELTDFTGEITKQDLFVCVVHELEGYLRAKKVPENQIMIMPIPADENMFCPLGEKNPLRKKYRNQVSYVKHGNADTEAAWAEWVQKTKLAMPGDEGREMALEFFQNLYQKFLHEPLKRWYEEDMQGAAAEKLKKVILPESWEKVERLVTTFSVAVYPACRRRYYLEGLAQAEIPFGLYGNDWDKDPQFGGFARGAAGRGEELNGVYNFSEINLHLHPYATMHQRLSECGLAGGFMMVADHQPEKDWEQARQYFKEDKEVVFFESREELVEKCRYYLEHQKERLAIAENMHKRAVKERTCKAGAKVILNKFRQLLSDK